MDEAACYKINFERRIIFLLYFTSLWSKNVGSNYTNQTASSICYVYTNQHYFIYQKTLISIKNKPYKIHHIFSIFTSFLNYKLPKCCKINMLRIYQPTLLHIPEDSNIHQKTNLTKFIMYIPEDSNIHKKTNLTKFITYFPFSLLF